MQPIDHEDPRKPYVQIAANIRAAILNGELAPGERLPTTTDLAEFFGVTRGTVNSALRILRDEGFVSSRPGSAVWVREQASLPVPAGEQHPLAGAATFLHEMGHLKNLPRAGWLLLGIPLPESVAEHSFRVGIVGMVLAALEGADVGHTAAMCILHDGHETRIGDVPSVGRAYVTTAAPEAISGHQTAAMPDQVAKVFQALTAEYEAGETLESRIARDADKVETLLQAAEYAAQGHDTTAWRDTSISALRTSSAKELARAIDSGNPHWWAAFAASYHELRTSAQKRSRNEPPK
jgi:5'-deoxynucleotidase YfbR-like HD superfamily hydrolase